MAAGPRSRVTMSPWARTTRSIPASATALTTVPRTIRRRSSPRASGGRSAAGGSGGAGAATSIGATRTLRTVEVAVRVRHDGPHGDTRRDDRPGRDRRARDPAVRARPGAANVDGGGAHLARLVAVGAGRER